jgi:dTDP-4-amino-4,6-dideoxygalactose transaminase
MVIPFFSIFLDSSCLASTSSSKERVSRKRQMLKLYMQELSDIEEIQLPETDLQEETPWFIDIMVPDPLSLRNHLEANWIGGRPVYPALHNQPVFNLPGHYPDAEYIATHGL